MSFREKKAWVTMMALIVVTIPYIFLMVRAYHQPDPDFFRLVHLVTLALITFVVLEIALVFVARKLSPEDAGIPKDERDQLFAFRAARFSYVALIILMIAVTFVMIHDSGRNWGYGMLYLNAIVCAEIMRAIVVIVQYRRGY